MRNLVRRYVTKEQRNADNQGVTEDDVNEIKQDISAFRFELIEIMKNSGFNTSTAADQMQGGMSKGKALNFVKQIKEKTLEIAHCDILKMCIIK